MTWERPPNCEHEEIGVCKAVNKSIAWHVQVISEMKPKTADSILKFLRLFCTRRPLNFPEDLREGYSGVINASSTAQGFLNSVFKFTYLVSLGIIYYANDALRFLHLINI